MTRSSETVRVEKVSTIIVDNNNERFWSNEKTHLRDTRFLLSYFLFFISFIFSPFFILSSCWSRGNKMALLHWRNTDVPNRVRWGQWNQFFLPLFSFFLHFFFLFGRKSKLWFEKTRRVEQKRLDIWRVVTWRITEEKGTIEMADI